MLKKALQSSVATLVGLNKSAVDIVSIKVPDTIRFTPVRSRDHGKQIFRNLLQSVAVVHYIISVVNSGNEVLNLKVKLNTAISSGTLSAAIQSSFPSLSNITTSGSASIIDIPPPTTSPTIYPSPSSEEIKSAAAVLNTSKTPFPIAGIIGGSVGLFVFICLIFCCWRCSQPDHILAASN